MKELTPFQAMLLATLLAGKNYAETVDGARLDDLGALNVYLVQLRQAEALEWDDNVFRTVLDAHMAIAEELAAGTALAAKEEAF